MTITTVTPPKFYRPIDNYNTADLQREVAEVNRVNGWHEEERTPLEGEALIMTELAEALEAYHDHGLADVTYDLCAHERILVPDDHPAKDPGHVCKPQGVGSELADVLIRLLDETYRRGIHLARSWNADVPEDMSFGDVIGVLNRDLVRFGCADAPLMEGTASILFGRLVAAADRFGIDLVAEYERKLVHNAQRGWRHGGKRL